MGILPIVKALEESDNRIQQPFLNLLNFCLQENVQRLPVMLGDVDKRLQTCLVKSLTSARNAQTNRRADLPSRAVLAAKSMLTLSLLSKLGPQWLLNGCDFATLGRLLSQIETEQQQQQQQSTASASWSVYFLNCAKVIGIVSVFTSNSQLFASALPAVVLSLMTNLSELLSKLAGRKNIPSDLLKELKVVIGLVNQLMLDL